MSKKNYTPDIKGVTQWLKDNPTKKNSRGRTVSTGIRDAYKAVGYKGPPLKSKEGNLTNNRNKLRLSPRGDNGDTARAAASNPYTVEEFIDYGKRNGYGTEHSKKVFKQFQEKNRAQKASILPGQANDHVSPNSAEYHSAGENHRNRVGLGIKVNGFKTNKMPTPAEMREAGIPTTRSSLIQMEFNNTPAPNPKTLRSLASKIARDPSRPRATSVNRSLNAAQLRKSLLAAGSKGVSARGSLLGIAAEYLSDVDQATGGHINNALKQGMESLKIAGQKVFDAGVSKMLENRRLGYDLTIQ